MAGKFINTTNTYAQMTTQVADTAKSLLSNPYYLFSDKKSTEVTYYNINITMTTLDEASRGNYAELSPASPIRYNQINGFLVFGLGKIEPNLEMSEFGLETSDISGECIVLPRTIIPYPGDYFYINQLDKPYLLKVTSVNPNTLETGSTMYRITYTLVSSDGVKSIQPQVVKRYRFMLNPGGAGSDMGSNMSASIIDEDSYDLSNALQDATVTLKDYFISLFYDNKVQSFTYKYRITDEYRSHVGLPHYDHTINMQKVNHANPYAFRVYDAFLIEFLIRNKIISGSSTYLYVGQQVYLPSTFGIDYDRTIFSSLEDCDINKHYGRSVGNLIYNDQRLSLLYAFPEDYYMMQYGNTNAHFHLVSIFDDPDFKNKVSKQEYYSNHPLKNFIIKYFNGIDITINDIKELKHLDYKATKEYYYDIPFAIFVIEKQISKIMSSQSSTVEE